MLHETGSKQNTTKSDRQAPLAGSLKEGPTSRTPHRNHSENEENPRNTRLRGGLPAAGGRARRGRTPGPSPAGPLAPGVTRSACPLPIGCQGAYWAQAGSPGAVTEPPTPVRSGPRARAQATGCAVPTLCTDSVDSASPTRNLASPGDARTRSPASLALTPRRQRPQRRPQPRGPGARGRRPPAPWRRYLRATAGTRSRGQRVPAAAGRGGGKRPPPASGATDWLSAAGPAPVTPQAPPTLKAPSGRRAGPGTQGTGGGARGPAHRGPRRWRTQAAPNPSLAGRKSPRDPEPSGLGPTPAASHRPPALLGSHVQVLFCIGVSGSPGWPRTHRAARAAQNLPGSPG